MNRGARVHFARGIRHLCYSDLLPAIFIVFQKPIKIDPPAEVSRVISRVARFFKPAQKGRRLEVREWVNKGDQPRPQGLLAFQNGGGSGEDPGTQQITCLQRGWRCIQNGGYGEKGEKNWVRDAKVKINKMAEKAEVQFKKK